jgi:hypothetical protein
MSDVCDLWNGVEIAVPAIPVHLVVQIGHRNIQVLDVRPQYLARRDHGVTKPLFPFGKLLFLDGIAGGWREVMLYVPFEANGRSKHVTMLRNVTDTFARLTLNLRKEGASNAVEAWEAALLSRTLGAA